MFYSCSQKVYSFSYSYRFIFQELYNFQNCRYPSHGCCQYQCSYRAERRPAARPVTLGFPRRRVTPPSCHARDVFDGDYRPLIIPSRRPTVLLFWTRWCLASIKVAHFFNRFAKENARIVSARLGFQDRVEFQEWQMSQIQ